ncbi:MAG: hypothetical protein ACE5GT_07285 [Rhodospirillales bacterium]
MADEALKAAEAWLRHFQEMAFDVEALVDPARAAGRVGERMRPFVEALPFDRVAAAFAEVLESFAGDGDDD